VMGRRHAERDDYEIRDGWSVLRPTPRWNAGRDLLERQVANERVARIYVRKRSKNLVDSGARRGPGPRQRLRQAIAHRRAACAERAFW